MTTTSNPSGRRGHGMQFSLGASGAWKSVTPSSGFHGSRSLAQPSFTTRNPHTELNKFKTAATMEPGNPVHPTYTTPVDPVFNDALQAIIMFTTVAAQQSEGAVPNLPTFNGNPIPEAISPNFSHAPPMRPEARSTRGVPPARLEEEQQEVQVARRDLLGRRTRTGMRLDVNALQGSRGRAMGRRYGEIAGRKRALSPGAEEQDVNSLQPPNTGGRPGSKRPALTRGPNGRFAGPTNTLPRVAAVSRGIASTGSANVGMAIGPGTRLDHRRLSDSASRQGIRPLDFSSFHGVDQTPDPLDLPTTHWASRGLPADYRNTLGQVRQYANRRSNTPLASSAGVALGVYNAGLSHAQRAGPTIGVSAQGRVAAIAAGRGAFPAGPIDHHIVNGLPFACTETDPDPTISPSRLQPPGRQPLTPIFGASPYRRHPSPLPEIHSDQVARELAAHRAGFESEYAQDRHVYPAHAITMYQGMCNPSPPAYLTSMIPLSPLSPENDDTPSLIPGDPSISPYYVPPGWEKCTRDEDGGFRAPEEEYPSEERANVDYELVLAQTNWDHMLGMDRSGNWRHPMPEEEEPEGWFERSEEYLDRM
ncbi:hypothetical protein BCR34DRAFT_659844 [Clohesyomyces aquaticus]|uniref:Uncharacterized protein n=1 Tax=Clohesyomyces aquaticus TaxID=1231657 RepID=A0A1Y2A9K2_9PLEO|nr:hypothetical protein BCR34DRAFT_659844 [Clohesyomyces aquaticus]